MDVYLFDLEHINPGWRGWDLDLRAQGDGASLGESYDLSELNRMVRADVARRAELN